MKKSNAAKSHNFTKAQTKLKKGRKNYQQSNPAIMMLRTVTFLAVLLLVAIVASHGQEIDSVQRGLEKHNLERQRELQWWLMRPPMRMAMRKVWMRNGGWNRWNRRQANVWGNNWRWNTNRVNGRRGAWLGRRRGLRRRGD